MFPEIHADTWDLQLGVVKLSQCRSFINLNDGEMVDLFSAITSSYSLDTEAGSDFVCEFHSPEGLMGEFRWSFNAHEDVRLRISFKTCNRPLAIKSVVLYEVPLSGMRFLEGGNLSRQLVYVPAYEYSQNIPTGLVSLLPSEGGQDANSLSYFLTVIGNEKASLLTGAVGECRFVNSFAVGHGRFRAVCEMGISVPAGVEVATDTIILKAGESPHELLEYFGRQFHRREGYEVSDAFGWNSWDYYFAGVDEDDVYENVSEITKRDWLRARVKAVVLDEGWAFKRGDWRAAPTFGGDLRRFVERMRSEGFIPGVWVAPFVVETWSVFARRHQECFCRGVDGQVKPFGGAFVLDPTHPVGEEFLRDTFGELYELGIRYFKLDFLFYLLLPELYYRMDIGKIERLRKGLEIIRETVGDAYILGCGCPAEAGVGLVDGMRITPDISNYFSNVRILAQYLGLHYWMHGNLFLNDPDFLIVRGEATAEDTLHNPYHFAQEYDPRKLRSGHIFQWENESRCWASMVILSGGVITLSDRLSRLNDIGWNQIRTVFDQFTGEAAVPIDILEGMPPRLWYRAGKAPLLGIFNWEDSPTTVKVDLRDARYGNSMLHSRLRDIWSGKVYNPINGILQVELLPRDVVLLSIAKGA